MPIKRNVYPLLKYAFFVPLIALAASCNLQQRKYLIPADQMVNAWPERRILDGILWAISCIAFLAGGIGVLNTMSDGE